MVDTGERAFGPWTDDDVIDEADHAGGEDADRVTIRLQRMLSLVERTRAKIETLCVLGDLVGEKAARAATGAGAGEEALADVEQTFARLALQFQDSAEETERLLIDFAGATEPDDKA
jgi:hypothetical protein